MLCSDLLVVACFGPCKTGALIETPFCLNYSIIHWIEEVPRNGSQMHILDTETGAKRTKKRVEPSTIVPSDNCFHISGHSGYLIVGV